MSDAWPLFEVLKYNDSLVFDDLQAELPVPAPAVVAIDILFLELLDDEVEAGPDNALVLTGRCLWSLLDLFSLLCTSPLLKLTITT